MRNLAIVGALVLVACGARSGCSCDCRTKKEEPRASKDRPSPPPVEPPAEASFRKPNDLGVRRFVAPRGAEVVSVAASPRNDQVVIATGSDAYVFDGQAEVARGIDIPGVYHNPLAVSLTPPRAAVVVRAPTEEPQGHLFVLDARTRKLVVDVKLGGVPADAAALDGDRIAVVLSDPPKLLVLDAEGQRLSEHPLGAAGVRIRASADGKWAGVVTKTGVVVLDVSGPEPTATPVSAGQGKVVPVVALPVGGNLLVVGMIDSRGFARLVPRAGGEVRDLPLASGPVFGAAANADQSIVAVFGSQPGGKLRTFVYDLGSFLQLGVFETGVPLPTSRAVVDGDRIIIPACREIVALDVAALTSTPVTRFGGPPTAPCIDGIVRAGDRLAARDGAQAVTFPMK